MSAPWEQGVFGRLRHDTGESWERYVRHPFVLTLGEGTLPPPVFRHFLQQDYLFLIHFARAYALAGFKSDTLEDLRASAAGVSAIVDVEMPLHVAYCRDWGLTEEQMAAETETMETIAYTRFVLERGLAGDRLDLDVALAPCVVGYGEAVARLLADPATKRAGNPYQEWMNAYSGEDYLASVTAAVENLDRQFARRGGEARYPALLQTFSAATRLEEAFWQSAMATILR
jgi:thiaminase/transcriptional activator TenA